MRFFSSFEDGKIKVDTYVKSDIDKKQEWVIKFSKKGVVISELYVQTSGFSALDTSAMEYLQDRIDKYLETLNA